MADEGGINVAILKGLIQMDYDPGKMAVFLDQLTSAKAKQNSAKTESDRLKASFNQLAASLDPVVARTLKYDRSVDTLNRSLKAGIITQAQYNHNLALAKDRLQDTTTWTQRLGNEIGGNLKSQFLSIFSPTTLAIGAVTGGVAAIAGLAKKIIDVSIEAEESQNKVGAAVARYGERAGITAGQIDKLANAQSKLTGKDDEEIASAAALSLRFNRLSGEDIPRLTALAIDMAEVMGTDIPSAMDKSAAYINLPLQALTKLKKEGYAVSEGQSKLVKDFLKLGDVSSAQGVIFEILEEQYKGAAAAARDSLGGAHEALGTSWENLLETLGEGISKDFLREGIESTIILIDMIADLVQGADTLSAAFYATNVAVNQFLSGALKGFAELVDIVSKAAPLFGVVGIAVKGLDKSIGIASRARAGAAAADRNATESAVKLTGALLGTEAATSKLGKGTKDLTEGEENLNNALKKQAEALAKVLDKQLEQLRFLRERQAIANLPPGTDQQYIYEQLQQINEAHEYRLDLLAQIEQFGPKIGKQIADTNRELKKLSKDIDLKFKLQFISPVGQVDKLRSGIIDLFGGVQQGIDAGMNQLLSHLRDLSQQQALDLLAGRNPDPVAQGNEEMFADLQSQWTEFWEEYASEVRDGWKSNTDVIKEEMRKVEAAAEFGFLSVSEKERELARLRGELIANNLSEWGSFFGTLGNMFGGVFQQISQAINNIQQAQQAGQQLGGLIGGSGSSLVGALGMFGATVAIFYEIYKAVDAQIEKNRARKWGTAASTQIVGGEWSAPSFLEDRGGEEISKAMNQMIRDILDSLDAVISDLPQISIRARKDGKEFSAYVAGVFVGTFSDAQEAISEGVRYALTQGTFEAISHEMAVALQASVNGTIEELQQNIETANIARRARLGDEGFAYAELNDKWLRQIDAMQRMGLAIDDAIAQKNRETEAYKYQVLGMEMADVQRLRSIQSLSAGLGEAAEVSRAAIRQQMEEIQRQIEAAERQNRITRTHTDTSGGTGGIGGSGPGGIIYDFSQVVDEETQRLKDALAALEVELGKIPEALSDVEIDMGIFSVFRQYLPETAEYQRMGVEFARMEVEQKFKELKLTLIAMGEWEQWAQVWTDAYNNAMNLAGQEGKPRRGAGGGERLGGRDEVRDFLRDRRQEIDLSGLSEYARSLAELDRLYAPMLEKAGKDKKLREQLLALKDAELRQLERENIRSIVDEFQGFTGVANQFDDVRETASGLIKRIQESAMGDPRKAQMISRVLAEMNQQIDRMSKQSAINLFGEMANDLISFGETEESLSDARYAMSMLDHQLKMEHYKDEIELIRAKGSLNAEQMAILDDAFRRLQGIKIPVPGTSGGGADGVKEDPYGWVKNSTTFKGYGEDTLTTAVTDVSDNLNQLAEAFKSAKEDIKSTLDEIARGELGIVSPELAFEAAQNQYKDILARAGAGELLGFQEASNVARNYIEALKTFSPTLAATELPKIQSDLATLVNATTVRDENLVYSERFATNQERSNTLLETGLGALANINQGQTQIQDRMLNQLVVMNQNNAELNARLSRLEAGYQANKRDVA